jgi:peptide/nickel transport system permease protein
VRHLIRRLLFYICAIWVAITIDFFIPRLAPGDPVAAIVGKMPTKGYVTPAMRQTEIADPRLRSEPKTKIAKKAVA